MIIAVPVEHGRIAENFSLCQGFDLFYVDDQTRAVTLKMFVSRPAQRNTMDDYLARHDVNEVLAKRITAIDYQNLKDVGIFVAPGVDADTSDEAVQRMLSGALRCCIHS